MTLQHASRTAALLAVWGLTSLAPGAQASTHDFPFSYDWAQAAPGEQEIEAHSTYLDADHSFEEEVEFEYGVNRRFSIAPYLVYAREPGGRMRYQGYQIETRYQLGRYKTGRVLGGLYEEYAQHAGEAKSLESRLILSRYDRQGGDLTVNYVLTNALEHAPGTEHAYSVGYVRPLNRTAFALRGGFEWIHNISARRINAGPVLGFRPSANTSLVAGYAFPLTRAGNKGELRVVAEYEF